MTCVAEREEQKTATALRPVHSPVRLDLIGGWSDQADWENLGEPGAVLSVSVGWPLEPRLWHEDPTDWNPETFYPHVLEVGSLGQVRSRVQGIGTGLGISSTIHALHYLQQHPDADWREWTESSVAAEAHGTRGGWQDSVGAILPGMKLLTKNPGEPLQVEYLPNHPLLDHLVLFDTGIRRNSGEIGAKVRWLMGEPAGEVGRKFRHALREAVVFAKIIAHTEGNFCPIGIWGSACVECWENLATFVPEMLTEGVPDLDGLSYGRKLIGAGGGGYGVYFAREPDCRSKIVAALRDAGFWATIPEVLDGYRWGDAIEMREAMSA